MGSKGSPLLGSKVQPDYWTIWSAASGVPLPGKPLLFESTSMAVQAAIEGPWGPSSCRRPSYRRKRSSTGSSASTRMRSPTGEYYWLLLPPGRLRPDVLAFRDWLNEESTA
ncbi:MAG: hypothetical protein WDN49_26455 [Acetobacteraceae bacterium]